jgi:hypothetical protein
MKHALAAGTPCVLKVFYFSRIFMSILRYSLTSRKSKRTMNVARVLEIKCRRLRGSSNSLGIFGAPIAFHPTSTVH